VLVRLDHVAGLIVNADDGTMHRVQIICIFRWP
jgi:hypothetical protein